MIVRALILSLLLPAVASAGYPRTFETGAIIVPMDAAYQDPGKFQAYGLIFALLESGITVFWVIEPTKTWHTKQCSQPCQWELDACDTGGNECAWDCWEEGSGIKCDYPTASPDFFASAIVLWDGNGQTWDAGHTTSDPIASHGYRGGPFVIDVADATDALVIVDAWNNDTGRTEYRTVSVHQTTAPFTGYVAKEMVAAPTIAVFSDGNEDIATSYLRAAGIKQSNGNDFPAAKCGTCGPGTPNPDMLTVTAVMGPMGECDNASDPLNADHKNGALFVDRIPAYCQIMSMHWGVNDRETVSCDGGTNTYDYHGHEVVAEVRKFLNYPTHFFAECQAVNAYENTVPNPGAPHFDDPDRIGHYLTTTGSPPDCPCTDGDFECVNNGCDGGTRSCCLPKDAKEVGAGFMIGNQPDSNSVIVLSPHVPYNQFDGWYTTTGGSEKSYNLSTYLDTRFKNDLDITFVTGPNGPGQDDVWMTGYLDGVCAIDEEVDCGGVGKVSYLGGHDYGDSPDGFGSQGTRMFLNALFEADCVTSVGQPQIDVSLGSETPVVVAALPVEVEVIVDYANYGLGAALDTAMTVTLPAGVTVVDAGGGVQVGDQLTWDLGSVGGYSGMADDPPSLGSRSITVSIDAAGLFEFTVESTYRVGVTQMHSGQILLTVEVVLDSDGDGTADDDDCAPSDPTVQIEIEDVTGATVCVADDADDDDDGINDDDEIAGGTDPTDADTDDDGIDDGNDPAPTDPTTCGDSDADSCDDCAVSGSATPGNDGTDTDGDGECDAGDDDDDGDTVADGDDADPLDAHVCVDSDGDTCDDCTVAGQPEPANDGTDGDGDGICDSGDSDDSNGNQCRDGDADGCDDCAVTRGPPDPNNDGTDTDGDGVCDAGDDDDDGDTVSDGEDPAPLDPFSCGDADVDTCDDCTVTGGPPAVSNDGTDTDGDGACDDGDDDDDGDGVADGDDPAPLDPSSCGDSDSDTCDDCALTGGPADPSDDGDDLDGDGICDAGDDDDDADGTGDTEDCAPRDSAAQVLFDGNCVALSDVPPPGSAVSKGCACDAATSPGFLVVLVLLRRRRR